MHIFDADVPLMRRCQQRTVQYTKGGGRDERGNNGRMDYFAVFIRLPPSLTFVIPFPNTSLSLLPSFSFLQPSWVAFSHP